MAMTALVACSDDGQASTDAATVTTTAPATTTDVTIAAPVATEPVPATTEAAATTAAEAPETTAPDEAAVSAEALAWALDYASGTAGPASGEPVVIGVADFADYPADPYTSAMADFINAELGGIDGRPIEIVSCDGESDAAGCAEQLGGDPDVVAVMESLADSKDEFHQALADRKPVLTVDPFLGTQSVAFIAGALQIASATGLAAATVLPGGIGRIAVVGRLGTDVVVATAVHAVAPEAEVVSVRTPESADEPSFDADALAAAAEAAGASDVDVVIGFAPVVCDTTTAAWDQLGMQPEFVWPTWCEEPDGIVVGDQVDFADPDLESGELTVVEAMDAYLTTPADVTREGGALLWIPAALLLLTSVLNDIGVADASTGLAAALAAYDGPAPFGVGNADCAVVPPTVVSADGACTTVIEVARRAGGLLEFLEPVDLNR
jgi:branched-chain amino acid transport system substrate-binding protein